jgi:hypothetical protein
MIVDIAAIARYCLYDFYIRAIQMPMETKQRARVRTFSAVDRDVEMLEAIAAYHGFSKSSMITSLVRKEFWRVFPGGTGDIRPDDGAAIVDRGGSGRLARANPAKGTKSR